MVLYERFLTRLRQLVPGPDKGISVPKPLLVQIAEGQMGRLGASMAQGPQLTTLELGVYDLSHHLSQLSSWCWEFDLQAGHTPSL